MFSLQTVTNNISISKSLLDAYIENKKVDAGGIRLLINKNIDSEAFKFSICKSMINCIFATTLQILSPIRKYKTFIAATFLAIYTFVAMPVQLWHQHHSETRTQSEKSPKKKHSTSFSNYSQQAADTNCQIYFSNKGPPYLS